MRKSRTKEHQPTNATSYDLVLSSIAASLKSALPWVSDVYAFSRILRDREGMRELMTYAGGNEYMSLMPSGGLGNYIALRLQSTETRSSDPQFQGMLRQDKSTIDLIAFFDFREMGYADPDQYTEANVAEEIRAALALSASPGLYIESEALLVMPEDVFSPADLSETDSVLLRRPYGCLSLALNVYADNQFYCSIPSQN